MENIAGKKGANCTFQTGIDRGSKNHIRWSFTALNKGSSFTVAQLFMDYADIGSTDFFNNRLHLDSQTGSLTIMDITVRDSGIYELQIMQTGEQDSFKKFLLFVYGRLYDLEII